jgi:2-keto-4-pentenoate hydratase
MMDIEKIAETLEQETAAGNFMPQAWRGKLSMDQAYRVQLAIMRRRIGRGERQTGWKVGLTAAAMRAQQNVHEPCFGYLLESGHRPSGHRYDFDTLIAPGFENELCLRVSKTLRGPGVTLAEVAAAITHAAPALEVIEKRGNFTDDLPLAMADNAQQHSYVTGAELALNDANGDLGVATVDVTINGEVQETAPGSAVMGEGALLSVVWLANKLAEFELGIEAGQVIMSGSFTRQYAITQGMVVQSEFSPFGTVTARF